MTSRRLYAAVALLATIVTMGANPAHAQDSKPPDRTVLDCTAGDVGSQTYGSSSGTSHLLVGLADGVNWQPRDGRVRFIVSATDAKTPSSLNNIELEVCFGWPNFVYASADTNQTPKLYKSTYLRTIARTDTSITYETSLPDGLWDDKANAKFAPTFWDGIGDIFKQWAGKPIHVYDGWGLIPTVHMRLVARSQGAVDISNDPNSLDTVLPVGISFRIGALALTILSAAIAWYVLSIWADYRGVLGGPILKIITNRNGYASLSQFQILLWTVVIGGGLTYVMALSGALIDVPSQELALLGISGFSALSAAYASKNPAPAGGAGAVQPVPAVERSAPRQQRIPKWSDLVVWDGYHEIDITRVQMLVFTVLAAGFVVLKIGDDSAIPNIPDGIVLLMGLTNGVYVGGKLVTK
jgi:hypothetical protein